MLLDIMFVHNSERTLPQH